MIRIVGGPQISAQPSVYAVFFIPYEAVQIIANWVERALARAQVDGLVIGSRAVALMGVRTLLAPL